MGFHLLYNGRQHNTLTEKAAMTLTTRSLFWLGLLIAAFGWANAAVVVVFVPPSGPTVALLLELLFLGVFGLALSTLALVFRLRKEDKPGRVLRESALIGLFVVTLLTLQYFQVLSLEIGAGLALVFILFEGLFLYRARRRRPPAPEVKMTPPSRSRGKKPRAGDKPSTRPQ